jgi:oxygen-dependent protoporphyrinogen oxidase
LGSARDPEHLDADAVVLATPAAPTARLLRDLAPTAAAELAAIETASMAVVTLAFRSGDVPEGDSSGFLVPPVERRVIKASTFSFAKWDWVRAAGNTGGDDLLVLRTSIGRHGEEASLQVPDEELIARSLADLADIAAVRARPVDSHVQRWGGGLPQYAVGHLDRVARIRDDVARVAGLAVCGAAYDGVGIPAVIASARAAAAEVAPAQ